MFCVSSMLVSVVSMLLSVFQNKFHCYSLTLVSGFVEFVEFHFAGALCMFDILLVVVVVLLVVVPFIIFL